MLFTIATMVVMVNAVLGGATVTLILGLNTRIPLTVAIVVGVVVGICALVPGLGYQARQIRSAVQSPDRSG